MCAVQIKTIKSFMTPDDVTVLATKLCSGHGLGTDLKANQAGNGHKTRKRAR